MIRTRKHVIDRIEAAALPRSVKRAIDEGCVEFLGGFDKLPSCGRAFVVRAISPISGKEFYLAVEDKVVWLIVKPYWKDWMGDLSDSPLYQGDRPDLYKTLKKGERQNDNKRST